MSWNPPIGIPIPNWPTIGNPIDTPSPTLPDPWTSEVAGFYYVNYETGTNTGRTYGRPGAPRQTIPGTLASPLPAGSVVIISGKYSVQHSSPNQFCCAGTAENPCWLRGVSQADRGRITRSFNVISSTYLFVENILFDDEDGDLSGGYAGGFAIGDKDGIKYDSTYICVRTCEATSNLGENGGMGIGGYAATTVISNVVFYDNYVHDCGDVEATDDQDVHAFGVGGLCAINNVWIVDNEMARCSGDGIQVNGFGMADPSLLNHIYIGRNVSHHHKQSGMWAKTSFDVIFSQNTCYGHRAGNSSLGQGMGRQYDSSRVWFLYNHCYDNEIGIHAASNHVGTGLSVYIIGNLIHDIHQVTGDIPASPSGWSDCAIPLWGANNRYVVDNTIYDVDGGIYSPYNLPTYMRGNIISHVGLSQGKEVLLEQAGTWEIKNSIFHRASGDPKFQLGGSSFSNLATLVSAYPAVTGCLTSDPLFVDVGNGDFSIQSGSPAKDASTEDDVYDVFETLYGIDIRVDNNAGVRPVGAWDIGAFEYGSEPAVPSAPSNVVAPSITGTLNRDETLTAVIGTWTGYPARTYTYQWIRCDADGLNPADIASATSSTYILVQADVGNTIKVRVTATNTEGTANATSAATAVIDPQIVNPPTFSAEKHITFEEP